MTLHQYNSYSTRASAGLQVCLCPLFHAAHLQWSQSAQMRSSSEAGGRMKAAQPPSALLARACPLPGTACLELPRVSRLIAHAMSRFE